MSLGFRTLRTSNFAHPAQARRIRFPPVSQVSFFRTLSARLKQRTQPTAHRPGQDCVRSASQHRRFPLRSTRLSGWSFSRNFCLKEHRGHPSIALHALQRGRHWPERLLSARAVHRPCPDLCVSSSERSPSVGSPVDGGGAECARRTRGRGSTSACARPSTVLAGRFRQMVAACGLGRLHGVAAAETPATPAAPAGGSAACALGRLHGVAATETPATPAARAVLVFSGGVSAACGLGRLHGVAAAETPATPAARAVLFFPGGGSAAGAGL